ncbi:hypothetical protein MWN34_12460 [Ancylobacter sp. 6x-1]|uniref:Uncharacterized protein n=1 Tax=Ancylobacter crimeensis TaxID=2579147 RepID=A0ABT0DCP2_9HYPH|nr:hypothetical protein [Ancylobacter crimeensis]MCK0197725.1 hypothetical protein [Ancylobacter crimeensis]
MTSPKRTPLIRLLLLPLQLLFGAFILLDDLARPVYRPILAYVASLGLVKRFEAFVAARGRYTVLLLLAVPFAIVEPAKVIALIHMAEGHVWGGIVELAMAYLLSFIVVERILHAGRPQLMSFPWFAWGMNLMESVRRAITDWVTGTRLWQAIMQMRERLRRMIGRSAGAGRNR